MEIRGVRQCQVWMFCHLPSTGETPFATVRGRKALELHWELQCDSCQKRKGLSDGGNSGMDSTWRWDFPICSAGASKNLWTAATCGWWSQIPAVSCNKIVWKLNILRNRAGFCCRFPPAQTPTGSSATGLFLTSEIPRQLNTKQPGNQWEGEHSGPFPSHKK